MNPDVWFVFALALSVLGFAGAFVTWGYLWRSGWILENTAHVRPFSLLHATNAFLWGKPHSFGPFDNDGIRLRYHGVVLARWEWRSVTFRFIPDPHCMSKRVVVYPGSVVEFSGLLTVFEYALCVGCLKIEASRMGYECEVL